MYPLGLSHLQLLISVAETGSISEAARETFTTQPALSSLIGNLWLLQLSDMLSIASDRVADHFTQRGLIVPLEFELDALGTLGVCWRKEWNNTQKNTFKVSNDTCSILDRLNNREETDINHNNT